MSRLLCCLRARRLDMGAALSHPQEGEACDGSNLPAAPPTMADVIRERKKKSGGAALGTLRRRLAHAARRPRDTRQDRGCEHARYIRSVVASWRLADVFVLCEELEAGAALRDLVTQAELAREPAPALHSALPNMLSERWFCDVEVVGSGWSIPAHRAILAATSDYFRDLLQRYPASCTRVPLEGAFSAWSRAEAEAAIYSLYSGGSSRRTLCRMHKYGGDSRGDGDLDLVDSTNCRGGGGGGLCSCGGVGGAGGAARDPHTLHASLRYLLDSGEMSDAKLVFRLESGAGAAYGFRTALELPCHRVVLAARSRFFRSVMSRRSNSSGAVCVDEAVLPRRFARALLHAAYTDQVDLSLIGRNTSLPATTNSSTTSWAGVARGSGSRLTAAGLEDAFQLYEIARFLEMPIVVQGCEDLVAEALSPETLPALLRWGAAPHASHWVHRQAMRYLRDEFVPCVAASAAGALPASALAAALASPFLQASEPAALRALLKWASERRHRQREPNVVWHTMQSVPRRGARRRSLGDAALRDILSPLVRHVRTEHMPHDAELQQLVRRGIVPPPPGVSAAEEGGSAHAWLGRGSYRPARCFIPYLDEIKALLADQPIPEAEVARARRARYMHRIPDTLYMVSRAAPAAPSPAPPSPAGAPAAAARACVGPRAGAALRARVRELRAAPPARAAALPHHRDTVTLQIALRAVREMSLPDACAELLLSDVDDVSDSAEPEGRDNWRDGGSDCCSRPLSGSGSLRASSVHTGTHNDEGSRASTCARRELPARGDARHSCAGAAGAAGAGAALSAAVPDVAMAPNANTHLLTARDYCRHPPPWEYSGVVLQLDLGDGATHTPRPDDPVQEAYHYKCVMLQRSRAQRNSVAQQQTTRQREHAQVSQAISCLRARADENELRAAIELSVMRAYSSFHGRTDTAPPRRAPAPGHAPAPAPLPPAPPRTAPAHNNPQGGSPRPRAPHRNLSPSPSPSPSPRRRDFPHPHHDYRLEAGPYPGSASTSRGHSPNYA